MSRALKTTLSTLALTAILFNAHSQIAQKAVIEFDTGRVVVENVIMPSHRSTLDSAELHYGFRYNHPHTEILTKVTPYNASEVVLYFPEDTLTLRAVYMENEEEQLYNRFFVRPTSDGPAQYYRIYKIEPSYAHGKLGYHVFHKPQEAPLVLPARWSKRKLSKALLQYFEACEGVKGILSERTAGYERIVDHYNTTCLSSD